MKKQILIITAIAALTLAACGGSQNQNNAATSDTVETCHGASLQSEPTTTQPKKPSAILAEMKKDGSISDSARRFFEAINFQDPAELNLEDGFYIWKNGFSALTDGDSYEFRVYNKSDGTQIALMAKYKDIGEYQMPEITVWNFDGSKAEKINFSLPMPEVEEFAAWGSGDHSIKKGRYHLNLDETFIHFEAKSDEYDDDYENPELFLRYNWDGEKFVKE